MKETEWVAVRRTATGESTTVQKIVNLQLLASTGAIREMTLLQELPTAWQLQGGSFAPVVRLGTSDAQRFRGVVTENNDQRVAMVRLPGLSERGNMTTSTVTYGALFRPPPQLPYDVSITLSPEKLRAGQVNRVNVTMRLTKVPPMSTQNGLHAVLWSPRDAGGHYRITAAPKGFTAMDHCGTPGSVGGLWTNPNKPLSWELEFEPTTNGEEADLGLAQVTLATKAPLVASPAVEATPEAEVRHSGNYTMLLVQEIHLPVTGQ